MTRLLVLFFISIFFISCDYRASQKVLSKEDMISVLTDLHLADGYTSTLYAVEKKKEVAAVYKSVYKKHNTDSLQLRKSLLYYTRHPEMLQIIYIDVDSNIARVLKEEQKQVVVRQEIELQKSLRLQRAQQLKEKWKTDSINKLSGQYDFGLPAYFTTADPYLTVYRTLPVSKKIEIEKKSVLIRRADSLKKDSLNKIR